MRVLMLVCAPAMLRLAASAAGFADEAGSDWPTVAHDMQRTSFTAACPAPPYRIRWFWVNGNPLPEEKVKRIRNTPLLEDLPDFYTARFTSLAQPMVRGGTAYIGSVEGNVFAIDLKSGATKWTAAASGQILHSVSVGEEAVYAATLRGVDAFGLDGKRLWTFQEARLGSFYCCPALAGNLVLAGSLSGYFHGLDSKSGKAVWEYRAGAAIYHTAAVHGNRVIFGAEDMRVYCLDAASGKPVWTSERLPGVSFGHYWPVVAAKAGKVLLRTSPFVKCAGCDVVNKAPFDYEKAEDALREYFEKNPDQRDFFVLNLSDGQEAVRAATGHFGSQGDISPVPIVREDGSVLVWHYSKEGAFQPHKQWGAYDVPVDLGILDFGTGRFKALGPPGTTRPPSITRNDDFHHNTLGGNWLFGVQNRLALGCVPLDGQGARYNWEMHEKVNDSQKQGLVGFLGRCEAGAVCATITKDVVLVNPHDGLYILALESAPPSGKGTQKRE